MLGLRCCDLLNDAQRWGSLPELPVLLLQISGLTQQDSSDFADIGPRASGDPVLSIHVGALQAQLGELDLPRAGTLLKPDGRGLRLPPMAS